jgi:spermidine synthase
MHNLISLLFMLSGVTGLVYEVLWAKYLSLLLGNTAHAHTIVLATFLGG